MMRIDSHQHFWYYTPQDYRWISDEMAVLKQDLLPEALRPSLQRHNIQGTILVQSCSSTGETRWLLELAEKTDFVRAVVGWVDLSSPMLKQRLEEISHPLLHGFRHQVQDEISPAKWLTDPAINSGIRQLQRQEYVYDILVTHRHLSDAVRLAERHDEYFLVLDHFGKPDLSRDVAHWRRQVAPLAGLKHVSCKLSGLLTEPRPTDMPVHSLMPYFEAALEIFGTERLMFGSDWPVCLLADKYEDSWDLCEQAIATLTADEQIAICGGNACAIYQLKP
jgi:L-fuconolactonase